MIRRQRAAAGAQSPLAVQFQVLFALVMREMTTRYGKSYGGYAWALLEPLAFIALLSFLFEQIAHKPPLGGSFPLFYATGYLAFHAYMDISMTVGMAVQVNKSLMSFPRITLVDAVIARFVLQALTVAVVSAVILGGMLLMIEDQVRIDLGPLLTGFALSALMGLGVGALNCVLFAYSPTWQKLFGVINRPMFLISGVFFTFESMPGPAQDALWWNPLMHATALVRAGFYPGYSPEFVSVIYAVVASLTPLMIGVLLLRRLRAQILDR